MFAVIPELVNSDHRLVARGRFLSTTFLAEAGEEQNLFTVSHGRLSLRQGPLVMPAWQFALRAAPESWERFWQPRPEVGWHDLFAMIKFRTLTAEGDLYPFMTNLLWFKDVLTTPRALASLPLGKDLGR